MLPVFAWLLDHAPDLLVLLLLSWVAFRDWIGQEERARQTVLLGQIADLNARQTALQEKAFAPTVPLSAQQAIATFLARQRQFLPPARRAGLLANIDGPVLMRVTASDTPADHIQSIVETCAAAGEDCFRILLKNAAFVLNGSQEGKQFRMMAKAHGFDLDTLDAGPH